MRITIAYSYIRKNYVKDFDIIIDNVYSYQILSNKPKDDFMQIEWKHSADDNPHYEMFPRESSVRVEMMC